MFDPTAVRSTLKVVADRNGMYTFRGAYDGPVEFFRGRPITASAIWTSEADVVEIADVAEHTVSSHGVVEGWNRSELPSVIDVDVTHEEP